MLKNNGTLYISFPIGRSDAVHFNAHRIFHPKTILNFKSIRDHMELVRFDYVDDMGNLHLNKNVDDAVGKFDYACGIYTFKKVN